MDSQHSELCIIPQSPQSLFSCFTPPQPPRRADSLLEAGVPAASCCGVMQAQVASEILFRSQRNPCVFSQAQAQQGQPSPTHRESIGSHESDTERGLSNLSSHGIPFSSLLHFGAEASQTFLCSQSLGDYVAHIRSSHRACSQEARLSRNSTFLPARDTALSKPLPQYSAGGRPPWGAGSKYLPGPAAAQERQTSCCPESRNSTQTMTLPGSKHPMQHFISCNEAQHTQM